jgi:hypothetical protein
MSADEADSEPIPEAVTQDEEWFVSATECSPCNQLNTHYMLADQHFSQHQYTCNLLSLSYMKCNLWLKDRLSKTHMLNLTVLFRVEYTDSLGRSRLCLRKDLPHMQEIDKSIQPDK